MAAFSAFLVSGSGGEVIAAARGGVISRRTRIIVMIVAIRIADAAAGDSAGAVVRFAARRRVGSAEVFGASLLTFGDAVGAAVVATHCDICRFDGADFGIVHSNGSRAFGTGNAVLSRNVGTCREVTRAAICRLKARKTRR